MPKGVASFVTVLPDGSVQFDFDGHISAEGIDMVATQAASPNLDSIITWHKDTLSGAAVAQIIGISDSVAQGRLFLGAQTQDATSTADLSIEAREGGIGDSVIGGQIANGLAAQNFAIMSAAGLSSFIYDKTPPGGITRQVHIYGPFSMDSGIVAASGGTTTVTQTHNLALTDTAQIILGNLGASPLGLTPDGISHTLTSITANAFTVKFWNGAAGTRRVTLNSVIVGFI